MEKYQECLSCPFIGCIDCKNTTECFTCNDTGNFEPDGKGKCKCMDGFKLIKSRCFKCEEILGCLDCSDVNVCTDCNTSANF